MSDPVTARTSRFAATPRHGPFRARHTHDSDGGPGAGRRGRMVARHGLRAVTLAVLALYLTACGIKQPRTICPVLGVLDNASSLTKFKPSGGPADSDIQYYAEITGTDLDCEYKGNLLFSMEVNMRINIAARKGPAATSDTAKLNYFVVITDRAGNVITKKVFPATVTFNGRPEAHIVEKIWQDYNLARGGGGGGSLYEVWVGFQLTDPELQFNRTHQRN